MKRFIPLLVFVMLIAAVLAACSPVGEPNDAVEHNVDDPQVPAEEEDVTPPNNAVYAPVTVNTADVLIMESYPIQVAVTVSGTKPTPCNHVREQVAAPNADNEIHISLDSWADPALSCVQVLAEFEQRIPLPLSDIADGSYTVWVNGEQVGEFTYPGG